MITSFFSKACDVQDIFQRMQIAANGDYGKYRDRYPAIHISFSDLPKGHLSYGAYIERTESRRGLFLFWMTGDSIFRQDFVTEADKKAYRMFLRSLLKDRPYVRLAYMTGILPIAKYSSGLGLNMFAGYTMEGGQRFSEYFGFTGQEEDDCMNAVKKYVWSRSR